MSELTRYRLCDGDLRADSGGAFVRWIDVIAMTDAMKSGVGVRIADLEAKIERLQAALIEITEVAEDIRGYTSEWDWKYGDYWDGEIAKAAKAAGVVR